jgi:hypothetical protein
MGTAKLTLSAIWFVFAVVFLILGTWHWIESKSAIPPFEITKRADWGSVQILGMSVDKPLEDFARDFNEYLSVQNEASEKANRRAAEGYFVAVLTAVLSMLLPWTGPF